MCECELCHLKGYMLFNILLMYFIQAYTMLSLAIYIYLALLITTLNQLFKVTQYLKNILLDSFLFFIKYLVHFSSFHCNSQMRFKIRLIKNKYVIIFNDHFKVSTPQSKCAVIILLMYTIVQGIRSDQSRNLL